ncbi:MAG: GntR family transcriptional regulator [Prevotellaceae bacterium]|nr:GntR family transcriptional regulator [Prevotellaceae bacterium]
MDFKNPKAIYLQIADWVCDQILSGKYQEGDKLPAIRECATEMEVNINTVARAFEWLQMRDIVTSKRGMGNYAAIGALKNIAAMKKEEFFNEQLPDLFNSMNALGITLDEIERRFDEYMHPDGDVKILINEKPVASSSMQDDLQKDNL